MRRMICFMILLSLFIFATCSVNQSTGKIEVRNFTDRPLKNVKIGNTLIACYVAPGGSVDYWLYSEIKGGLTFEGDFHYLKSAHVDPDEPDKEKSQEDATFICKTGYWHYITAMKEYWDKKYVVVFSGYKQNKKEMSYLYDDELVDF